MLGLIRILWVRDENLVFKCFEIFLIGLSSKIFVCFKIVLSDNK